MQFKWNGFGFRRFVWSLIESLVHLAVASAFIRESTKELANSRNNRLNGYDDEYLRPLDVCYDRVHAMITHMQ